jgi:succinoglycan biosynthesis protein ExoO
MEQISRPTVSVLVPAFNATPFLERSVNSALNQTLKSLEIIIADDASTDNTLELARRLSETHPNVRVIALPENGGPARARNAAIAAATGKWLAVLDADDAYDPEHLEGLCRIAEEHRADVVLSNFSFFDPVSHVRGADGLSQQHLPRVVTRYEYVAHARPFLDHQDWGLLKPLLSTAFVRERSISYPTHSRHGEDFLMMLDCLLASGRVVVSPTPTYLYTYRSSGWSRTTVDYHAVVAESADLLHDPRIARDAEMVRHLKLRISAVKRLAGEFEGRILVDKGALVDLTLRSFRDYYVGRAAARLIMKRLLNWVRVSRARAISGG